MDLSLLTGKNICHKKMGAGTIQNISDNYIYVNFNDTLKTCKFNFPDAFDSFLTSDDVELNRIVARQLKLKKILNSVESIRRQEQLDSIDNTIKQHHKEEQLKKQRLVLAKLNREKKSKKQLQLQSNKI